MGLRRYFDVIDINGDDKLDIIGFAIPEPISVDGKALKIYIHPYPTGFDYN